METLKTAGLLAVALLLTSGAAMAWDDDWDDIFAPYRQRLDAATTSSGNAQNVNAATQMITPWPPYVHNRRIPGDGARMVGAVQRYHDPLGSSGAMASPQKPGAAPDLGGTMQGGDAQQAKPGPTAGTTQPQ